MNAKRLKEVQNATSSRVPTPSNKVHSEKQAVNIILRKCSWSAPGSDRIVNFWSKKAVILHAGVIDSCESIVQGEYQYPWWFAEGKKTL